MVAKGHKLQDCDRITTTLSMKPELFKLVAERAKKEDRTISNMISILVKRGMESNEPI